MYRAKIRDYYDHLSRSYRKVADFVLSNYYEVAFMTAAQLAEAVDVDTTTVVRFSQRLGYNGYPEMLHDVRAQVRSEIYAYYEPPKLTPDDPAAVFRARVEQEEQNLAKMLIHNPAEHIAAMAKMVTRSRRIVLIAEGYVVPVAELTAQQLRHRRFESFSAANDTARLAATLVTLTADTLVVGTSSTSYGRDVRTCHAICPRPRLRHTRHCWFPAQSHQSGLRSGHLRPHRCRRPAAEHRGALRRPRRAGHARRPRR